MTLQRPDLGFWIKDRRGGWRCALDTANFSERIVCGPLPGEDLRAVTQTVQLLQAVALLVSDGSTRHPVFIAVWQLWETRCSAYSFTLRENQILAPNRCRSQSLSKPLSFLFSHRAGWRRPQWASLLSPFCKLPSL